MTYSQADFQAKLKEGAAKRHSAAIPAARALQAAGVVMTKLVTGNDDWNRYLSYVQGQIDKTRVQVDAARVKQDDPAIWDIAERNKLKADILQGNAMIAAWEWAMAIPKALVDGGAEATEFLSKLEKESKDAYKAPGQPES